MNTNMKNLLEIIFRQDFDKTEPFPSLQALNLGKQLYTVERHHTILYQSDPVDYFYILLSGRAAVLNQIEWSPNTIIEYCEPMSIFGLIEHLCGISYYTAFVCAETKCTVLKLPAKEYIRIIKQDASLCYQTLVTFSGMTQASMNRSEIKYLFRHKDVLGSHLYQLSQKHGIPYTCPITRADLAEELHINLRTLYRYTSLLEQEGYFLLRKGKIVIEDKQFARLSERYGTLIL